MFKPHHDMAIVITFGFCNNWDCGLDLLGPFGDKKLSKKVEFPDVISFSL